MSSSWNRSTVTVFATGLLVVPEQKGNFNTLH